MSDFLAMGGYAEFVWSSFGLAALVMVFNVMSARRRLRLSLERATMQVNRRGSTATHQLHNKQESTE